MLPELTPDDRLLLDPMEELGMEPIPAIWDDPKVDWTGFEVCVIRSPWDYHLKEEAFLDWIDRVSTLTQLVNPAPMLLWNMSKTYLRDFASLGIPTVPTEFVAAESAPDLDGILHERGWREVVIKPEVGATGSDSMRALPGDREAATRLAELSRRGEVLVQECQEEVLRSGEVSLVFLDGELSHSVRKTAADGDYRVHAEFGGRTKSEEPTAGEVEVALEVMDRAGDPLYARVDLIGSSGGPLLSELELIEPELFFREAEGAAKRFAELIATRV